MRTNIVGVPVNETLDDYEKCGVRVVGYLKSDSVISSGDGTAKFENLEFDEETLENAKYADVDS